MTFDTTLFSFLFSAAHITPIVDVLIAFFARFLPYLMILGTISIVLFQSDWKKKFYAFSLVSLSLILSRGIIHETIQFFYNRPRPPLVLGIDPIIPLPQLPSFPSSHAVVMFALATSIFFIHKKWGMIFLGLASLVGIARVMGGVHWPLDIVGGAAIAMLSVYVVKKLIPSRRKLS